jgi:hypothetical protein
MSVTLKRKLLGWSVPSFCENIICTIVKTGMEVFSRVWGCDPGEDRAEESDHICREL